MVKVRAEKFAEGFPEGYKYANIMSDPDILMSELLYLIQGQQPTT